MSVNLRQSNKRCNRTKLRRGSGKGVSKGRTELHWRGVAGGGGVGASSRGVGPQQHTKKKTPQNHQKHKKTQHQPTTSDQGKILVSAGESTRHSEV